MSHTLLFSQNVHTKEKEGFSQDVRKAAFRQNAWVISCLSFKKTGSI